MKQIPYSDFEQKFQSKQHAPCRPLSGQWALTNACNLGCVHCCVAKDADREELSFAQITDLLDQLHEEGCLWLTLTGGEPLVRPDFFDIYAYAIKKGFLITLFTNGTLLTAEAVRYLKKYPPFMIEITFHSCNPLTFDSITRVAGSFKRCRQGIELIMTAGLPLVLKTVGLTLNKKEILKTKAFVKKMKGINFKFDPLVMPKHNGSREPLAFRLTPQEVLEIESKDKAMREQWRGCAGAEEDSLDHGDAFRCAAGETFFHINPYGGLQLCPEMARPVFDLAQKTFQEGFFDFLPQVRRSCICACQACAARIFCSQCPALSLLENGHTETTVDYLCRLARLRQEYFSRP
jgi:MoaA/NifB/PqqE/SkfB family radical SAM enzyme